MPKIGDNVRIFQGSGSYGPDATNILRANNGLIMLSFASRSGEIYLALLFRKACMSLRSDHSVQG